MAGKALLNHRCSITYIKFQFSLPRRLSLCLSSNSRKFSTKFSQFHLNIYFFLCRIYMIADIYSRCSPVDEHEETVSKVSNQNNKFIYREREMHHDVIISFSLSACYSSAGFRYSHIHILHPTVVCLLLGLGKESNKTVQEMESKEPGCKFLRSLFYEKEILDLTYRPILKYHSVHFVLHLILIP